MLTRPGAATTQRGGRPNLAVNSEAAVRDSTLSYPNTTILRRKGPLIVALAAVVLTCRARGPREGAQDGELVRRRAALLAGSGALAVDPLRAGEPTCPAPLLGIDAAGVTMSTAPSTGLWVATASPPPSTVPVDADREETICRRVPRRDGRLDTEALTALLRAHVASRPVCPAPPPEAPGQHDGGRQRSLRILASWLPPDRHVIIAPSDATPWQEIEATAATARAAGLPDVRFVTAAGAAVIFRTSCRPAPR
jgi:hypothetical protein